jgi:hypothetical protein
MKKQNYISILLLLAPALFACTIGLALGTATSDGRPIVFKNRDITSWSLEYRVDTPSSEHAHVRNSTPGNSTAWMGANEVGFAIVQSAAYNVTGSGSGLTNGTMMNYALKNCTTVDDFEAILIATNGGGRNTQANYAVIDAYGNGAIFECSPSIYARYNADSLGIVVRANFAYIGGSGRVGQNRMERAYDLMAEAIAGDSLDALFISKMVVSDLLYPGQDPYPLPWTGSFPGMPAGYVNTGAFQAVQTICNYNTRACGVAQGALLGGDPENTLMWCFFGQPVLSIPIPIFPSAHDQPPQVVGSSAPMRVLAQAKSDSAFDHSTSYYMNTGFLLDASYSGVLDFTIPTMEWAFDTVNSILESWEATPPSASQRSDFQDTIAARIYDAYSSGEPMAVVSASKPREIAFSLYPNPFNSALTIEKPMSAKIEIFDLSGRQIDVLNASAGGNALWVPRADVPSGIYFVRCTSAETRSVQRVVLMK